ncbi:MAG: hypothetical protein U5J64_12025 [Halobacteriales archaeon]|nr:hypothetical protein [Halobacteriales archaeon]
MDIQLVERGRVVGFWREKFGVPSETFDGYVFYKKGAKKVWAVRHETVGALEGDAADETETLDTLDYESVGLPLMRVGGEHDKPTTDALQLFGDSVTKNAVELDAEDARDFVRGEDIDIEFGEDEVDLGYVVVKHDRRVLGCGLYFPGELRSQVPKGRRVELNL